MIYVNTIKCKDCAEVVPGSSSDGIHFDNGGATAAKHWLNSSGGVNINSFDFMLNRAINYVFINYCQYSQYP